MMIYGGKEDNSFPPFLYIPLSPLKKYLLTDMWMLSHWFINNNEFFHICTKWWISIRWITLVFVNLWITYKKHME